MACAAQLELLSLVMQERLYTNVLVFQGFRLDSLGGFATLLVKKGAKGFHTHQSIMWRDWTEVFHSVRTMLCKSRRIAEGNQKSYWYEEVRPKV